MTNDWFALGFDDSSKGMYDDSEDAAAADDDRERDGIDVVVDE